MRFQVAFEVAIKTRNSLFVTPDLKRYIKNFQQILLVFVREKTDVKRYVLNDVSHWLLIQLIQPVLMALKEYLQRKRKY